MKHPSLCHLIGSQQGWPRTSHFIQREQNGLPKTTPQVIDRGGLDPWPSSLHIPDLYTLWIWGAPHPLYQRPPQGSHLWPQSVQTMFILSGATESSPRDLPDSPTV